ncbi:hypothetical protein [Streptomyces lunaelactis]|uniref:hypothetical protein n=1 Tax=Streptomyces lunaelactis TaxID=1535768 RepID=UPI0028157E73|nr:hypothetical protein [Streptomyces lunaelactis]
MSAPEERGALTPRPSLYEYALRLHRAEPDGRLPKGGYPLPDPPPQRRGGLGWAEAQVAVRDALVPLLSAPDTVRAADEVHLRLHELGALDRHIHAAVAGLPLDDEATARALGRRLARMGTSTSAVSVGVGLLARLGEPEDVPYLKILGLLHGFARPAVQALTALDCPTAALVWLGHHVEGRELRHLVDALAARDDQAARTWLLEVPVEPRAVSSSTARKIAEAVRLADVLREDPVDSRVLAQAGRLLSLMTSLRDYRAEILAYPQALTAYDALVARASQLPPTLDHYATLLSLALDLHSGPSFLLNWRPGQREALLNALETVLGTPAWSAVPVGEPTDPTERRRTHWIRRAARQPFSARATSTRLRVEVAVRDPADPDTVETRLLIDGRPLVPEAFGLGPANSPEYLLDSGRLRATAEAREVQLAEAYCTEGCCGALYVTICREGEQVVWRDWRRPATPPSRQPPPELPEYRFNAADYDAEIARAESDHSWAWPARITARLIAAGLRDRPDLLTRWDAQHGWTGTAFNAPDVTSLSFTYWPGLTAGQRDEDGPWLQFLWRLPEDGTPPEDRAAAALRRLATEDPKTYADVRGGSREHAEALGFPWPERESH